MCDAYEDSTDQLGIANQIWNQSWSATQEKIAVICNQGCNYSLGYKWQIPSVQSLSLHTFLYVKAKEKRGKIRVGQKLDRAAFYLKRRTLDE